MASGWKVRQLHHGKNIPTHLCHTHCSICIFRWIPLKVIMVWLQSLKREKSTKINLFPQKAFKFRFKKAHWSKRPFEALSQNHIFHRSEAGVQGKAALSFIFKGQSNSLIAALHQGTNACLSLLGWSQNWENCIGHVHHLRILVLWVNAYGKGAILWCWWENLLCGLSLSCFLILWEGVFGFFYLAETIGLKFLWWGRFVASQLAVVLLIYAVLFKSPFPSLVYVFQLKV